MKESAGPSGSVARLAAPACIAVGALFHYLGPAFAVLLFARMLSILPASATVIGLVVLAQLPTVHDLFGVALVAVAVAIHQQPSLHTDREEPKCSTSGSARPV
ncbi:hypothetical protein [Dactylosporangium salmoneum]|uniref:EamA domain-containing protein n=1 Tax=Dactylosporangium salmoneum TaxID=53361 RepID=A0ABN3HN74_9ACTN